MTRDSLSVVLPAIDNSQSIGYNTVTPKTVTVANGIAIQDCFANKDNSLSLIVNNTAATASTVKVKAGDKYPNAVLGDLETPVAIGLNVIQFQDPSRFENNDGSVNVDFGSSFVGSVYAVAKRAGLEPVA